VLQIFIFTKKITKFNIFEEYLLAFLTSSYMKYPVYSIIV